MFSQSMAMFGIAIIALALQVESGKGTLKGDKNIVESYMYPIQYFVRAEH